MNVIPVYVRWEDASNTTSCVRLVDMKQLVTLEVIGFLVQITTKAISVAHQKDEEEPIDYRYVTHIPIVNIIEIRKLRKGKEVKLHGS